MSGARDLKQAREHTDDEGSEANEDEAESLENAGIIVLDDPPEPDTILVVDEEAEPAVFSKAAAFRPFVLYWSLVVAVLIGFGTYVIASLLFLDLAPAPNSSTTAPPRQVVAAAPLATGTLCSTIQVTAFYDLDGNGQRGPQEEAIAGLPATVHPGSGTSSGVTNDAGEYSVVLDRASAAAVSTDTAALPGLWPARRRAPNLGSEALLSSAGCGMDLGFVWIPAGGTPPKVAGSIAQADADVAGRATPSTPALLPHTTGVQLHGRVWSDSDNDGFYSPVDESIAGATVVLSTPDGGRVASIDTQGSGLYSFANLAPDASYVVELVAAGDVLGIRALGSAVESTSQPVVVTTGSVGLPVWGLDFMVESD